MLSEEPRKGVPGRETTSEILRRLKSQEDRPRARLGAFNTNIKQAEERQEVKEDIKTIPEQNIENTMKKIEALERRMNQGEGYLSLYYDLKKLEERFLKEMQIIEKNKIYISENVIKRALRKKQEIEGRSK